ncbi:unnamed protein product, partial [Symbiodinium sp. KB8]
MESLLRSFRRLRDDLRKGPSGHLKDAMKSDIVEAHIVIDNALEPLRAVAQDVNGIKVKQDMHKRRSDPNAVVFVAPNKYVHQFLEVSKDILGRRAWKELLQSRQATQYGEVMKVALCNDMALYIHLKDARKLKRGKRWSQALKRENDSYETLMLTSDGDTEFDARGVALLRDELLKDPNRGAVCGRIRPCGNNGMIMFFQSFEYAAGHWFQKTAEDSLGSVLCCPGAFSMFRMKAIQDIADTYSSVARGAKDFFLMDQGEDRWMSLLLLEKGYQLTYCSQAEAMTE